MEPYIYQRIHTLDHRPLHLAEHLTLLDRYSRALFKKQYSPDIKSITSEIDTILREGNYPIELSAFVTLRVTADGTSSLEIIGGSLYRGYALRSINPSAISLQYDLPHSDYPTSVRESAADWAQTQALLADAKCAIRYNSAGVVVGCDDAPLFAVKGAIVYTSSAIESLERELAIDAIRIARLELREQTITIEQLPLFDELFYFDYRGITSIGHCDGRPYMSIIVERVARTLHKLQ